MKVKSLTIYVCFSIGFTILYTIAEFITASITGISHDTLTTCVYGFFAGEVISCAILKAFKIKKENDYDS